MRYGQVCQYSPGADKQGQADASGSAGKERKTRQEAALLLESDLRKALKKGYGSKELCALLKNEGIIIPAYLIRQFCSENGKSLSVPSSDIDKAEDSTMSSSEGAELPEQLDVVTELGEGISIQRNYERF